MRLVGGVGVVLLKVSYETVRVQLVELDVAGVLVKLGLPCFAVAVASAVVRTAVTQHLRLRDACR